MPYIVRNFLPGTTPREIFEPLEFENELDAMEAYHDRSNSVRVHGGGAELIGPDGSRIASTMKPIGGGQLLRTPAECLTAEVDHNGRRWMLVLLRTFDLTEGSCVLEVRNEQGNDSEAVEPCGQWRINRSDDGPAALSVTIETGALEDLSDDPAVPINELLDALVDAGGHWCIESHEVFS